MTISTRTPEGSFGHCRVCGQDVTIEPSQPPGDAPCPFCGSLVWFSRDPASSPDPGSFQNEWSRILELALQIEDLSEPATHEEVFFPTFLQLLLISMNAPAGLFWLTPKSGEIIPLAEQGLGLTNYRQNIHADEINSSLLKETYHHRKSQCFGAGESNSLPTPTNHLYVITPVMSGTDCLGLLEVLHRPDTDVEVRPGYQQFIEQMSGFAARYIRERRSRGQLV